MKNLFFLLFFTSVQGVMAQEGVGDKTFTWGENEITVSKKEIKSLSEYNFSLGFNFDFLDGVKANDLYADMSVQLPFLFSESIPTSLDHGNFIQNLGLEFGVKQNRTISNPVDTFQTDYRMIEADILIDPTVMDTSFNFTYVTTTSNSVTTSTNENLSFYLMPQYPLIYTANDKGAFTRLSALLHLEWLNVELRQVTERSFTEKRDAERPESWETPYELDASLPQAKTQTLEGFNNVNFGLGMELVTRRKNGSFFCKMICGVNNLRKTLFNNANPQNVEEGKKFYYLINAEVSENKVLGIKLGAEIRGRTLVNKNPSYAIYLAKSFNFEKLASFLTP